MDSARQNFRSKRAVRPVDGILLLNKPVGLTSNAALQRARSLYAAAKGGHGGSLDPLASGMLPLCFGQASKVCGSLLSGNKTYQVIAACGAQTETGDTEGDVIAERPVPASSDAEILTILQGFVGEQLQCPPMYSALKHQGERLYDIARRGESVERPLRPIVIHAIQLQRWEPDAGELHFEVRCSKGTYVRTLVEDIAVRIGTVAHVRMLHRVHVDPFATHAMLDLEQLEAIAGQGHAALDALLLPADQALLSLPEVVLDEALEGKLLHGQRVLAAGADVGAGALLRAYGPQRRFLGVVEAESAGFIHPKRLFAV